VSQNPFVVFKEVFWEEYEKRAPKGRKEVGIVARAKIPSRIESTELPTDTLKKNFGDAMSTLGEMFAASTKDQYGPLQIDSMEVNLEVSAEGKLAFLGTGGSVSGKTSFKIQFKRKQ